MAVHEIERKPPVVDHLSSPLAALIVALLLFAGCYLLFAGLAG